MCFVSHIKEYGRKYPAFIVPQAIPLHPFHFPSSQRFSPPNSINEIPFLKKITLTTYIIIIKFLNRRAIKYIMSASFWNNLFFSGGDNCFLYPRPPDPIISTLFPKSMTCLLPWNFLSPSSWKFPFSYQILYSSVLWDIV